MYVYMSALAKISSLLYNRKSFLRRESCEIARLLSKTNCVRPWALSLVCGLALPLEPVEAKDSKDSKAKAAQRLRPSAEIPQAAEAKSKAQEPRTRG
jgi:hypothetical protein